MADAVKAPEAEAPQAAPRRKKRPEAQSQTIEALELALEEEEGGRKKRRGKKRGLIGLIVLVVLVAAAGVFLYLTIVNDWGGVRTAGLTFVNKLDPQFRYLQEQKLEEYNLAKAELETAQAQLLKDQQALDQRKGELDRQQAQIKAAEENLEPLYRRNLSEEKLSEIKQTAKIYENMDPQAAAGIMSRLYDETYMAALIYHMSAASSANVMSYMSADLAARITTELLKN